MNFARKVNTSFYIFSLHCFAIWSLFLNQYPVEDAVVLGRYTVRYAIMLGAGMFLILFWGVMIFSEDFLRRKIPQIPRWLIASFLVASAVISLILWQITIDQGMRWFMLLSMYSFVGYLIHNHTEGLQKFHIPTSFKKFGLLLAVFLAIGLSLQIFSIESRAPGDEAFWADLSTAWLRGHSAVFFNHETGLSPLPGYNAGTSLTLGSLLYYVDFSPYWGRFFNLSSYLLGALFTFFLLKRVSNKGIAILGAIILLTANNIINNVDFRPHHAFIALTPLLLLLMITNIGGKSHKTVLVSFFIGLIATSLVQWHLVGALLTFTFSLFYAKEFVLNKHNRYQEFIYHTLPFGIGALIGVGLFWWLNVAPFGGLDTYLGFIPNKTVKNIIDYSPLPLYLLNPSGFYWRLDPFLMVFTTLSILILLKLYFSKIIFSHSKEVYNILTLSLYVFFFGYFIGGGDYPHVYIVFWVILSAIGIGKIYALVSNSPLASQILPIFMLIIFVITGIGQYQWQSIMSFVQGDKVLYGEYLEIGKLLTENYITVDDVMLSSDLLVYSLHEQSNWYGTLITEVYNYLYGTVPRSTDFWETLGITTVVYIDDGIIAGRRMHFVGLSIYMRQRDYIICDKFSILRYTVTIYRASEGIEDYYCPNIVIDEFYPF